MGVNGLFKFLKDKYGNDNIYETIHMSHFSYKIIYFDISSYIYSYIKIYGKYENKWLNAFVRFFLLFKQYKIHLIPIFDGKSPPEKREERDDRKLQWEKSDEKCLNISIDLEKFKNTGEASSLLQDISSKLLKNKYGVNNRILKPTEKPEINIDIIEEHIQKRETELTEITYNEINSLKELLTNFGIPYIQAPDEAEALCNDLVNRKLGDATFSLDSDCVAYGVDNIIMDLDTTKHTFKVVDVNNLCNITELTKSQLRDLCILCGVDYNRHSKPKLKIGPVNAYKLIKEHGSFTNVLKGKDIEGFRYDRCLQLFSLTYPQFKDITVWNSIESDKIIEYLNKNNLHCSGDRIKQLWKPVSLVFID